MFTRTNTEGSALLILGSLLTSASNSCVAPTDAQDGSFQAIEARVATLEANVSRLAGDVGAIEATLVSLRGEVNMVENRLNQLSSDVDALMRLPPSGTGIAPVVFTPFDDARQFLTLGPQNADGIWRTASVTSVGVPVTATVVLLNVNANARGMTGAAAQGMSIQFRKVGDPDPRGSTLTGFATSDVHLQSFNNTVLVPLVNGQIQYHFDNVPKSGSTNDLVTAEVKVQGYW